MKIPKTISLACATALALAAVTAHGQNVLLNPGFETDAVLNAAPVATVTDWTDLDNANTASANNAPVRTGIGSLQLIVGGGGYTVPEVRQTFAASPGQTWDFKGYMLATNTLVAPNFALLKIVWKDAGGTELAPGTVDIGNANFVNPGIESTPFLNNSSTTNTWIFTQAKGVAPAGTASVLLLALLVNDSACEAFFDDMVATNSSALPLTAAITSPANLAQVLPNFTITATASVLPGAVTNVDFYVDNVFNGSDDSSPYTSAVVGASFGSHALKVVAQGTNGFGSFISVTSSVVSVTVTTNITVYINPANVWSGYLNVFELGGNGGYGAGGASNYVFGAGWAPGDLKATFAGSVLALSPNTIADAAGFWYVTTTSPSVGNKITDASMYVEPASGVLNGATVGFAGTCITNTLAIFGNTNTAGYGWTCVAFIKDLAPDYSSANIATTTLTNGQPFSIKLATINDPARHVQYGFITFGPCVWATDPVLPNYGKVQVGPPTANAVIITPSLTGSTFNMSFPTYPGIVYTVQYTGNLTAPAWTTLTTTNGTGVPAVVSTSANNTNRFYRVSAQ